MRSAPWPSMAMPAWCGLVVAGFVLWGHPSSPYDGYASINPLGQIAGAIIMFGVLGFLPGFVASKILNSFGLLRIPKEIELLGLDFQTKREEDRAAREVREAEKSMI